MFIREVRSSGVRASITIVHIRKFYKILQNIIRFRFFSGQQKGLLYQLTYNPRSKIRIKLIYPEINHLSLGRKFAAAVVNQEIQSNAVPNAE